MPARQTSEEHAPTMTLEQWGDLPEDEPGELVDGRLVEDEEVGAEHDLVAGWLMWIVGSWCFPRGGIVASSDTRFAVSPTRGRKLDVYVYFPGRRPPAHGLVTVPPDLMIEIVSPRPKDARRDRVEKLTEYAAFGVRYYWIVDPGVRALEVLELDERGRYSIALSVTSGTVTDVPGCEGLTLELDALWSELDRLGSEG